MLISRSPEPLAVHAVRHFEKTQHKEREGGTGGEWNERGEGKNKIFHKCQAGFLSFWFHRRLQSSCWSSPCSWFLPSLPGASGPKSGIQCIIYNIIQCTIYMHPCQDIGSNVDFYLSFVGKSQEIYNIFIFSLFSMKLGCSGSSRSPTLILGSRKRGNQAR